MKVQHSIGFSDELSKNFVRIKLSTTSDIVWNELQKWASVRQKVECFAWYSKLVFRGARYIYLFGLAYQKTIVKLMPANLMGAQRFSKNSYPHVILLKETEAFLVVSFV